MLAWLHLVKAKKQEIQNAQRSEDKPVLFCMQKDGRNQAGFGLSVPLLHLLSLMQADSVL